MVNTIRGSVDASELGQTLVHEHIAIRTPGIAENWPDRWNRTDVITTAQGRLKKLESAGIHTLVDLTTADMGRDVPLLSEVANMTTAHIIACTGIYWIVPRYWWNRPVEDLTAVFSSDIEIGMQGSSVRAGIIKLASDHDAGGVSPLNEKCLRAGARAQRQTGVPIATHANPPTLGLQQQNIFADEGVDLSRVVIGHQGDTADLSHLKEVMERGSFIGMDRFGMDFILPFADRVETVVSLCKSGYADRIVLSHDASCALDWIANPEALATTAPNWHFSHISEQVVPALIDSGVSREQVETMLVHNPRRLFSAHGA
jgi:phosphotriesterase-related protein